MPRPSPADRSCGPSRPPSDLWALLYVQVRLADASDWRNILIGRTLLRFSDDTPRALRLRAARLRLLDQDEIEAWLEALGCRTTRLSACSLSSCFRTRLTLHRSVGQRSRASPGSSSIAAHAGTCNLPGS